jgi:hypothetical protein
VSKKLRIWVAMAQALLAVSVFSWAKFGSGTVYDYYAHGIRDLVTHLNLPLAIMWIVVSFPFHWLGNYIPPATGLTGSALTALLAAGMALSVAAFWYLVVTEIQMRRRGLSMLRPLSRLWASFVIVALFCFGAGVFTYAYVASRPLWYVARRGAVLSGLFPTIWGVVIVGVAIHDLLVLLSRERIMRDREERPDHRSSGLT